MKNKTSLMLMELLIMVLIFALAGAICLRVFARSQAISVQTQHRSQAVLAAQNAAETVKACADLAEAARILDARADGCSVQLTALETTLPGLAGCEILAECQGETFRLQVYWQEVAP